MSNLSGFVKRLRDIMRNDAGINGDAQRIEQIAQMSERNTVAVESTAEAVHHMSDMSREIAEALKVYKV